MGLQIGQVTGALSALRESSDFGRTRVEQEPEVLSQSGRQGPGGGAGPLSDSDAAPPPSVGVGQGLSTPGAALQTIDRTVSEVRRNTPTIQEIRAQFRVSSAENRDRAVQLNLERPVREPFQPAVESRIPEPAPQARNFITETNDSRADVEVGPFNVENDAEPVSFNEVPDQEAPAPEVPSQEVSGLAVPNRENPAPEVPEHEAPVIEAPVAEEPIERPGIDVKV